MEEKRKVIRDYVAQGLRLDKALSLAEISRSTYYYKPNGKHKGHPPSTHTRYGQGWVSNDQVVKQIEQILEPEFIDYGYTRVTIVLKDMNYEINKKKVYRLMKEHQLLNPVIRSASASKPFIVYKTPQPDRPFHTLEIDIKYLYIHHQKRNAYLIAILDTFNRQVLEWDVFDNMKSQRVIDLVHRLTDNYLIVHNVDPKKIEVIIRTDNGSQFLAKIYKAALKDIGITRNYIPKATPQMNGHIESFYSTVQKLVCNKWIFESTEHAREIFTRFMDTYNNHRIMESILGKSPVQFIILWYEGQIGMIKEHGKNKFYFKGKDTSENASSPLEAFVFKN